MAINIGEMLTKAGLLSPEQLDKALKEQREKGSSLSSTLVRLGYATEVVLVQFLSKQLNMPMVSLTDYEIEPTLVRLIKPEVAQKFQVIPIKKIGRELTLAMVDPTNLFAIEDIKFLTGLEVKPAVAAESSIKRLLDRYYPAGKELVTIKTSTLEKAGPRGLEATTPSPTEVVGSVSEIADMELMEDTGVEEELDVSQLVASGQATPTVKLVNYLLTEAVKTGASDIHIEPYEKILRIRFRIDGVLREIMSPPPRMQAALVSRIKILSRLDITERRKPQDGRINVKVLGKKIDLRVSVLPVLFGEKIVMRILDSSGLARDLTTFGFSEAALKNFMKAIHSPYGILLVTGPTGSGKTTTLYSALGQLNTPDKHILTVEDPIEYNLKGVNQVWVNPEIGLTFATALRALLRQAPNIVMLGEIRDGETAEIAIRAALTGHLVLSTIHTNDAPSTISRLIDMGIEPFLVASSCVLIQAQRLVRRICTKCKEPTTVNLKAIEDMGFDPKQIAGMTVYKGRGCPECNNTGYKGRIGLYEVMPITPEIREMILARGTVTAIRDKAVEQGMQTLRMDAIEKVRNGITTIEEVMRETAAG
ncbi:MAG: type IV-A pilus assembly ATPase PilB [Candidatus Edwardsbacteria bacterium]